MRELSGAVAVITGAASGIGRALAFDLAKLGAQLALADMNTAGLEETRKLLGDAVWSAHLHGGCFQGGCGGGLCASRAAGFWARFIAGE